MTQEDKELLLVDLSARLPYGVKIRMIHHEIKDADSEYVDDVFSTTHYNMIDYDDDNYEFLPYLRSMSSMTEEEKKELQKVTDDTFYAYSYCIGNSKPYTDGEWHNSDDNFVTNITCNKLISWLDKNHFDHRTDDEGKTLIEKGLALEAPEGMYGKEEIE